MLKVALRGLSARKARTLLTSLAVVLGVALVAGTYVFTDTIRAAFDDLIAETQGGIDVKVAAREGEVSSTEEPTLPAGIVERVRGVEGAELASPALDTPVAVIDRRGEKVGTGGAPAFAVSAGPERFDPFAYEGRPPRTPDELALDAGTVRRAGFRLGERVRVAGDGPAKAYTLVGIGSLGEVSSVGGVSVAVLTLGEVQRIAGLPGRIREVDVAAGSGTSPEELRSAVVAAVGRGVSVQTGEENVEAQVADIREGLGFLTTALLVFGVVALLVGAFVIYNTFSITVAQRTREFGMLRAIGASRRQVLSVVVAEGLLIGVLASALGVLLGLALAPALNWLFTAIGLELPGTGTVVAPRTIILGFTLGIAITLVASVVPAVRATRVSPVAALREGALGNPVRPSRWRTVAALALLAGGIALLSFGLFGGGDTTRVLSLIGAGALLVFLGVALFSPLLVGPLASLIGRPLERTGGVAGRVARGNAVRNPGRTAGTAAALMIGLALVSFTSIFAAGFKASFAGAFEKAITADLVIAGDANEVPAAVEGGAARVPGVAAASGLRSASGRLEDARADVTLSGLDPATAPRVLAVDWQDGASDATLARLGADGVAVEETTAEERGLAVGSRVRVRTPSERVLTLEVRGTYADQGDVFGELIVVQAVLERDFAARRDLAVLVDADGDVGAVQRDVQAALEQTFPTLEAQTGEQFVDEQVGQVDQLLALLYGLLALAVIISLFGIINTLALSVYERTRELGLLRAVGASRRQVRRIVRGEAIITALIGGVLGLAVGIFFAVIVSRPLASEGFVLSFPILTLVAMLVVAGLAGVVAAIAPARRASRLDVLRALSYE